MGRQVSLVDAEDRGGWALPVDGEPRTAPSGAFSGALDRVAGMAQPASHQPRQVVVVEHQAAAEPADGAAAVLPFGKSLDTVPLRL